MPLALEGLSADLILKSEVIALLIQTFIWSSFWWFTTFQVQ
jgi:hypothetical protein